MLSFPKGRADIKMLVLGQTRNSEKFTQLNTLFSDSGQKWDT